MAVPFGFSIGDLVVGIKGIVTCIEAVHEVKGASAHYQGLTAELQSLQSGLEAIDDLHLERTAQKQHTAIAEAVGRCHRSIEAFVKRIAKYQPWLQPGLQGWKANVRKMQWAMCKKEDVLRFKTDLERHSSSVNMLLATLQVRQTLDLRHEQQSCRQILEATHVATATVHGGIASTRAIINELSTRQEDLFQRLILSNQQLVKEVVHLQGMLQLQNTLRLEKQLPPQVLLQRPVVLLDACGKVAPFHLEFINSMEAFVAVLKVRFKQNGVTPRGLRKLDRLEFVLRDQQHGLRVTGRWETIFKPGQKIDMSMVIRRYGIQDSCPSCHVENEGVADHEKECSNCGLLYSWSYTNSQAGKSSLTRIIVLGPSYYLIQLDDSSRLSLNEINEFRRVQIIPAQTSGQWEFGFYSNSNTLREPQSTTFRFNTHSLPIPLNRRDDRTTCHQNTCAEILDCLTTYPRKRATLSDQLLSSLSNSKPVPTLRRKRRVSFPCMEKKCGQEVRDQRTIRLGEKRTRMVKADASNRESNQNSLSLQATLQTPILLKVQQRQPRRSHRKSIPNLGFPGRSM